MPEPQPRDMDLVRQILLDIEVGDFDPIIRPAGERVAENPRLLHHVEIMADAGLLEAFPDPRGLYVSRMTWEGHDFLDSVRDQKLWDAIKTKVGKHLGSASFAIWKVIASEIAKKAVGLGG